MDTIFLYIICSLITLFTIFLIIIYSISNILKSYPCYFNIYFCIIITLDNVIRIIPAKKTESSEDPSISCQIQAIILTFFDKLFVSSITSYCIINYVIMLKTKLYSEYALRIYIILIVVSIIISIFLTALFFLAGISNSNLEDAVCYVKTSDSLKKLLDSIYTGILLFINLFCIIRILFTILKVIKDCEFKNNYQKKINMKRHFWRFFFDSFLIVITFIYVILLINKKLPFGSNHVKDIVYIILCLINELYFTLNAEFYKEMIRIITCNKIDKYKNTEDCENKKKLNPKDEQEENEENEENDDE